MNYYQVDENLISIIKIICLKIYLSFFILLYNIFNIFKFIIFNILKNILLNKKNYFLIKNN